MSAISTYLEKIKNAKYGRDVRSSIYNAIQQCYKDVTSATLRETAFNKAIQSALSSGTIAPNSSVTYRMDQLSRTSFITCLTNGTYVWPMAYGASITDMPKPFFGAACIGELIVVKATASSVFQLLIIYSTNPSIYARRITTDEHGNPAEVPTHGEYSWQCLGTYQNVDGQIIPSSQVATLELLPSAGKGTMIIQPATIDAAVWADHGGPVVHDSQNMPVALCPGTFVSENPIYPYGNMSVFGPTGSDDATYTWLQHYYGIEATTKHSYHFMRRISATVSGPSITSYTVLQDASGEPQNGENGWFLA